MNTTPTSSRLHIALFGRRNAGKSSLINALTNQEVALVSDIAGTTTDPVSKAMEILPIGPVVIIDTAGLDDVGPLGELRVKKTYEVLNKTDLAILVIDGTEGVTEFEEKILQIITEKNIPVVGVINKKDLSNYSQLQKKEWEKRLNLKLIEVSARNKEGIEELKMMIIKKAPSDDSIKLVGDLIKTGDLVILVVPIDKAAPKGRLILPQQQTIRDILDTGGIALVVKDTELDKALKSINNKPSLVITDSQVFNKVGAIVPPDIPLTSFSILFARYKGDLEELVKGVRVIEKLKEGDKVLIAEGCTHHRQEDDIGTVKIPRWLRQKTGKNLQFSWSSGMTFPADLESYSLIVHCGACMLNRREMLYRISYAKEKKIPIVNYGILIAYVNGLLPRAIEIFKEAKRIYEEE
ncbi:MULTISPECIES: [FeFe] hydrogenase H-cluster maturation GTPase HydF [Thermoanaerobacter]|uniref:Hydrogenase maturation GTPase HydF n=2 Tax=Thermoanaerobacter TaxID=1754 RepID=I8QY80_9THEO|nr:MULTISPECIES: [FeFe] hydrogenase H-cluster maturation GTPase HydF [Thermoanaerobacter]EGD52387.1 small GTP-binding protein [Thermoanaerobacter ethanolicus JW 200]EIV99982.1 LOW QUALITY PROTEIN: hydrogenase maturation GTPase HydF [Thermoanaerobacter siderophilus SR4]SFE64283.1 [FeFe] hydrogenase H-cluster maturation GTPase HydF [Thermoanaerobacter thermohydrosulfuricus]HHY79446.1 [FeFe] hydrogenase H-cluster maturation GTPase HydF [Thermoanaerobacter sp.]AEM79799.1 small GTP-binding protein 